MRLILKQVSIAVSLLVVCAVIFAATKAYGVWVISGVAIVLFGLGLLRKENASAREGHVGDGPSKLVPKDGEPNGDGKG